MNEDPDLFGNDIARARARRDDPVTSHLAADHVTLSLRQIQQQVLGYAVSKGSRGFTDPEMNLDFGTMSSSLRSRRAELVDMGLIEDSGNRWKLGGRTPHTVWRITDEGQAAWARLDVPAFDRAA